MKKWITNNFLPMLLVVIGFIADDTTIVVNFLNEISAPTWSFSVVKYIGMIWAAYKLYNAKSPKIKNEIAEAYATDPNDILGTDRPNDRP